LRAHELRHESDAILIGAGTALSDDPLLTDRSGKKRRRPLLRVVLDESLKISTASQLVTSTSEWPLLIFAGDSAPASKSEALEAAAVEVIRDETNGRDLVMILEELGNRSIQSIVVEGGANVAGKFLDAGLVNKVSFFIAPILIGGRDAPTAVGGTGANTLAHALPLDNVEITQRGRDIEITGYLRTRP
jgi:diaminohydroxyphosphoribosylaminopyrimidine deaminase/5-amino-6-(5-phosphoribosylamino)uracil reductase